MFLRYNTQTGASLFYLLNGKQEEISHKKVKIFTKKPSYCDGNSVFLWYPIINTHRLLRFYC